MPGDAGGWGPQGVGGLGIQGLGVRVRVYSRRSIIAIIMIGFGGAGLRVQGLRV